ncbi:MAG: hypothetical protein JSU82_16920 [Rhodospirillales bacterium]|nr:MAG: hypothetical protein JSU82_16920 [Rhodospirillales bacterium]
MRVPGLKDWWPERPPTIVAEPAEKRYDAFMDLWPSLEEMLAVFRKRAKPGACGVPIAVEMVGDVTPESDIAPWPDFDTEVPVQSRPDDWVFLGYDICDFGWISGLSNCGGSGEEMRRLRAAWQDRLNAFGLFESRADAAAYRAASDQRVAEHAPFRIFALYRAPRAERR